MSKCKTLLVILFPMIAFSSQAQVKLATGAKDRASWVKALQRIAYPVVHNLANNTLQKNMLLEMGPGYTNQVKQVTYLEALGRTLAGIAPWLALPDDNTAEGALRKKMRTEALQALANAADTSGPDFINFDIPAGQPIVDAAFLAHAFIRAPKALWEPLSQKTKQDYINSFKTLRNRAAAYSNWLLFAGITEGFLLSIGESYDPARIQFAVNKMSEWYVGDGWYSDGEKFSMDYYNSFVIHPMMVDLLKILSDNKKAKKEEYDQALKRMVRHAEYLERIIAPDGSFPVYGRSMTYRSGAFQALAQTVLLEQLPEHLTPGQVRSALTQVIRKLYDGNQNFDRNNWLVLGFNGHQPELADTYTSTGSLYMATLAFLPLGLPADNTFWTAAPGQWTSAKIWAGKPAKKDYRVAY